MEVEGPGDRQTRLLAILAGLVLVAANLATAFHRNLVNDDYALLYGGWLSANGFVAGRDFSQPFYHFIATYLSLVFRLAPLSFAAIAAGRALILLFVGGIAFRLHQLTGWLFGAKPAVLAPVLALATIPFLYRDLDLRSDLISTFLWLSLFALLAREGFSRPRPIAFFGALMGMVLANRWKAVIVYPVAGLSALWVMHAEGLPWKVMARRLALMAATFLAAWGAYLGLLGLTDSPSNYLHSVVAEMAKVRSFHGGESLRTDMILSDLAVDPFFWVLSAAGISLWLFALRQKPGRHTLIAGGILLTALMSVALNPSYYPYNLQTLLALLSPFAAAALGAFLNRVWKMPATTGWAVSALMVFGPLVGHAQVMIHLATHDTLRHQLKLLAFVRDRLPRDGKVFGADGLGIFRPPLFHWFMDSHGRMEYQSGEVDYSAEWAKEKPEMVVESYRVPAWLNERDTRFLESHFVPLAPRVLVPGYSTGDGDQDRSFELLAGGRYELLVEGDPHGCRLDGVEVAPGPVDLVAGAHLFTHHAARCTVRRYYAAADRESIADPEGLPYLLPPVLAPMMP